MGLSAQPAAPVTASAETTPPVPVLHINADPKAGHPSSPLLYGIMTEEINYSYEGGLYAELVINRSFQHNAQNPDYWSLVKDTAATGSMALDRTEHLNDALPVSLRIDNTSVRPTPSDVLLKQRVGVANDGYWGVPVQPGTTYHASFFAKTGKGFSGPVTLSIESNDGATVFARTQVANVSGDWRKYEATLTTGPNVKPSASNRLVLLAGAPGTLWLSQVSLFPPTWNDRPNGLRKDLMQLLADMHPAFLRFPGGNYVEGNAIANRFDWKKTIGPVSERPGHLNDGWGYHSEDGLGLLEFLTWCEDLKMEPVLAVYAAYSMNEGAAPQVEPYVQDALDEIEYVTGATTTKWGAQRAKDGHPEPFRLTYVEIGNEDGNGTAPRTYNDRFAKFYDAIKAKHPNLQLIATANVQGRTPDLKDDHSYFSSNLSARRAATRYDRADRTGPKVMFGEYATQTGGYQNRSRPLTPDLGNALGDAAFLTGLERNSDHVLMASYAPLFINMNPGGVQWQTDLIGYDAVGSFGSVSYYVQKMFNTLHGDVVLSATADNFPIETPVAAPATAPAGRRGGAAGPAQPAPTLFQSVTSDTKTGAIYLKVVNTAATAQPLQVDIAGAAIAPNGEATVLQSGSLTDANSLTEPLKVSPFTAGVSGLGSSFARVFPANSVTVLQLEAK